MILTVLLFACSKTQETHPDYEILFEVNGIERTVFDFESEYVEHLIKTGKNDSKRERYAFLSEMIDNLLLAEAAPDKGLLEHPTYLAAIEFQERKSIMDVYFVDEMDRLIEPPTDDEVRLAYDKKQRRVFVRQLFSLREEDLTEPYQRLKSGENFVDVANDYFETATYDSSAGYLGPISYFGVDDAFAEAAFSTNQGDFTQPVRSRFGYHIIYVEYIEFPAMLAEDDYQYRKAGITSQVRLRNQQIISDEYVRDLMGTLAVEGNSENISALRDIILNQDEDLIPAVTREQETNIINWDDRRLAQLEASFPNETILATYVLAGERVDFTFDDYLNWLPYLSFQESKSRTGASVGRALRNEVLYEIGVQNGYDKDERVIERVKNRGYEILAELSQYEMTLEALADTNPVVVPASFTDRLIDDRELLLEASYWKILAEDRVRAFQIRDSLQNGANPKAFPAYKEFDFQIIESTNNDFDLVSRGLINNPVLAHSTSEGWMVINVLEREVTEISKSTSVTDLETRYKVYSKINGEIKQLREWASIEIDTLLFDSIYEIWNNTDN
ncbi:MAG: peptidylprolyl isomerase [Balneolales bacterium]|nr:peptidylprolyl isomerase [Balneolales bacterium]